MKRFLALLTALALVCALMPAALADGETITITNSTELMNAITNQLPGQTWNIAAGTYYIDTPTTLKVLTTLRSDGSRRHTIDPTGSADPG